ncbi:sodium:calcium antiporter [Alkalicoccus halolimnae]|uniref:Sodium:calcium antiporter n=1 Tax=Alkalicoccus halolimnae TaxID=1667239 RepID=A0A5C7F819_9BACI|nr:sodium:calcium antiporter [Alkalicoccus halolimnae]TXF86203.1 sodium:calcium antiporter [Alkalicoccus halolimnae]
MNILMFVLFIVSAVASYYIAVQLASYGDGVKEKTRASTAFVGILIGVAISLPELTASGTAIIIDSPDLAIGNLLGSNLFNILALALLDIHYRRQQIMEHTNVESKLYSYLLILMTMVVMLSLTLTLPEGIYHIGYTSVVLVLLYFGGIKWINSRSEEKIKRRSRENLRFEDHSKNQVLQRFIIFGLLIMVAGSILTISADQIAQITGLGTSFIGSILVGASTSLPDAVSVATVLKLGNYNMAVSSMLGSSAFNIMLLSFTDGIYFGNNLFEHAGSMHIVTGAGTIIAVLLVLYSIARNKKRSAFVYVLPSLLIVGVYVTSTVLMFLIR